MYKPLQLEISVNAFERPDKKQVWDVCEAGGGDMVAELAEVGDEGQKIAKLFAASPDLYHALLGMVNYYANVMPSARKRLPKQELKVIVAAEKALKRVEKL